MRPMGRGTPVVLFAHPSSDLYGADRMVLESVRAVGAGGDRVVVVLPADGPLSTDGPLRAELERAGAQVRSACFPVLRKQHLSAVGALAVARYTGSTVPSLVRMLRDLRPGLVYVNTITIPVWTVAARVAGVPAVVHVHEAEEVGRLLGASLAAPLLLARAVIVPSLAARRALVRAVPGLAGRIQVVPNGVAPPAGVPVVSAVPAPRAVPGSPAPGAAATGRPARGRPDGPARLLLVGRLSPRKGTDVAVGALAELRRQGRDVVLDLVGDTFAGYEWFEKEVRRAADVAGLTDRVLFHRFHPDPAAFRAAADIVLVPSRVEPFGNVAVEALLAGRPLVASRVQGLTEIVQAGRTGLLVPPGDPVALADAVARLLDDHPLAERLAAAGRTDASARFGLDRYQARIRAAVTDTRR
ncbi:MAG: glycosyltransferase family 4 protein [Frankia sp.]